VWKLDAKQQWRLALSNVMGDDYFFDNSYVDEGIGSQTRSVVFPNGVRLRATYELKF